MVKRKDIFSILFFLFLSGVLIFCWFRFGLMYGGGDTGLPTYNPQIMLDIASKVWWDFLAPGIPVAQGLTSVPTLYILSIFQSLGANPVFIQASLFFILLFLMGYGMYLLALSIFGRSKWYLAIAAGIFYLFNPYMMIQVWHRFIHNAMFFAAFLPFLVMSWLAWIRNRNPKYLLLFLLTNFLGVYIYGTIAFIVAIWTLLFFLTLLEGFIPWKGRKPALKLGLAFLIGCFFWILTNSWWLISTFKISPGLFAQVHSTDDSLGTLISLSNSTFLPYTLRLINPFYLYWQADWGNIYQSPFFLIISWLFVLVVFTGFFRGLMQKPYAIWSLLFLIVIFLAKGAAPPFSFPYIFGFSHFFPLGVIRNPFEKLGILLPLVYAVLFSLGLKTCLDYGFKYLNRNITYGLLVIFIFFHMTFFWPMFGGKLFGDLDKQNFVKVPKSYAQTDEWIKQDLKNAEASPDGRILHLPLPNSEDVIYKWEYGYHGVEPSTALFTALPSIARGFDSPKVGDALSELSLIFHKPYASNPNAILKMLQEFNIKYILLHRDIEWLGGELYNPLETGTVLDQLDFLEKKIIFGDLTIYKLKDFYFSPKISLINNPLYYISSDYLSLTSENNNHRPLWLSTDNIELSPSLKPDTKNLFLKKEAELIISPEIVSKYKPQKIIKDKLLEELPSVRILPDSLYYPLIRLKEIAKSFSLMPVDKFSFKITLAGKRLVESHLLKEKGSTRSIIPQLREYERILPEIKEDVKLRASGRERVSEISINFILSRHIGILNLIKESVSGEEKKVAEEVSGKLANFVKDTSIVSNYEIAEEGNLPDAERLISKFNIPIAGKYELLQIHQQVLNIYLNKLNPGKFQINNQTKELSGSIKGEFISYGKIDLPEGFNEISFNAILSFNLADLEENLTKGDVKKSNGEIEITSGPHEISYIDISLNPVYGGKWYQLNFDSWFKTGNKFSLQIIQDTDHNDPLKPGQKVSFYNSDFSKDSYINYWESQKYNFYVNPTTTKVILRLSVEPWNGCVYAHIPKKCLDKILRYQYERISQIIFKNIKVVRPLTNPLILRRELPESTNIPIENMSFIQKDADVYTGRLKITQPTWLLFKESFDPAWELKLTKDGKVYLPGQHLVANAYANGWFIEQAGDYDFTLNFSQERLFILGILLAGLGWVIILIAYAKTNL